MATIVTYRQIAQDRDSTISSLSSQVSLLNFKVTGLQMLMDELSNHSAIPVSVEEVAMNPSAWVNRTILGAGNLTGPYADSGYLLQPYNFLLNSNGFTLKVYSHIYPLGYKYQTFQAAVQGNFTIRQPILWTVNGSISVGSAQYVIYADYVYLL